MQRKPLFYMILMLAIAPIAQAETIEGLIAAGKLETSVVVETPTPHFQKAPLKIAVEVGTPGHFSNGTRVRDFTVPGSVVRPVSRFALNSSGRIEGDTWAFQTWSFHIYAKKRTPFSKSKRKFSHNIIFDKLR